MNECRVAHRTVSGSIDSLAYLGGCVPLLSCLVLVLPVLPLHSSLQHTAFCWWRTRSTHFCDFGCHLTWLNLPRNSPLSWALNACECIRLNIYDLAALNQVLRYAKFLQLVLSYKSSPTVPPPPAKRRFSGLHLARVVEVLSEK
jgi:hypothetical protein